MAESRPGPRRRRRRSRRRHRLLRVVRRHRLATAVVVGVAVAAAVLAAVTLLTLSRAQRHLQTARAELVAVAGGSAVVADPGGRTDAMARLRRAHDAADRAAFSLRRDLGLRIAGHVPGLRTQRAGVEALAVDASSGAAGALAVLAAADASAAAGTKVDLASVERLRAALDDAARTFGGMVRPAEGLWGPLREARTELNRTAADAEERTRGGAEVANVAVAMLGRDGPRRYLVAAQNNAEMRAQGMTLSFTILTADGGALAVSRFGHTAELQLPRPIDRAVPPGTQQIFGALEPTRRWFNVNATADFAWSAGTMAAMYEARTGMPLDGVVAIDVVGLATLLQVTGPVTVPGLPEPVSTDNALPLLLDRQYNGVARNASQAQRREALDDVAHETIRVLSSRPGDLPVVVQRIATAAAGGHFRLWSRVTDEEAVLEEHRIGGGPAAGGVVHPFHVSVQNATATKLDYFVHTSVDMDVRLTAEGTAVIRTSVTIRNDAPIPTPPGYQFGPDGNAKVAGEYLARVYLWAPAAATQLGGVAESQMLLSSDVTSVLPGTAETVEFHTVLHDAVVEGELRLTLVPQPRASDSRLRATLDSPDWNVRGPREIDRVWASDEVLRWSVSRSGEGR